MKQYRYTLELITPCFCAGADPAIAELRAPSIRGQLRWWFRVLGGFRSSDAPLSQQEANLFGSTSQDSGTASTLGVRVFAHTTQSAVRDSAQLGHKPFSNSAYLTFPIQSRARQGVVTEYNGRGVMLSALFDLIIQDRRNRISIGDINALISIFGSVGSLGFRSRRAMGALSFKSRPPLELHEALNHFRNPENIIIKYLSATSSEDCIHQLGGWLKGCRAHGQSGKNFREQESPYFHFAKNDHDIGYNLPATRNSAAFRPALGLPIIQRTKNGTNNWEHSKGRFASPVILRPHRDENGNWKALVIFVECRKWKDNDRVHFNHTPKPVSLELYEAMKQDERLKSFLTD